MDAHLPPLPFPGEPVVEKKELFGTAVIEVARIAAAVEGDEILVSGVVRRHAKRKDFLFTGRRVVELRGFESPVRICEVSWRD